MHYKTDQFPRKVAAFRFECAQCGNWETIPKVPNHIINELLGTFYYEDGPRQIECLLCHNDRCNMFDDFYYDKAKQSKKLPKGDKNASKT